MIFPYRNKKVFYEVDGGGRPIVLLHGFLESSAMWDPVMPFLTKHFMVIRVDLPGHGKTDSFGEVHTMELMAEIVNDLLLYLRVPRYSVMGHSMGGYVALAMIELHAQRVEHLVLLNSTTAADSNERKDNRKRALEVIPLDKNLFVYTSILNLFALDNRDKLKTQIRRYQEEAAAMSEGAIIAAIKGMMIRKDRTRVLSEFKGGKSWICGKFDPILPLSECIALGKKTRTKLHFVQGGHMSVIENTTEIVKILHFIE